MDFPVQRTIARTMLVWMSAAHVGRVEQSSAAEGPNGLIRFGHALQLNERVGEARATYARCTHLHPAFADGWFEVGQASHALGDAAAAVSAFAVGARLHPSSGRWRNTQGTVLQSVGKTAEALHAYKQALVWTPADADVYFNLGTLHEKIGANTAALESYQHALALEPPDEARVHNNIGGVLLAKGDLPASML